MIIFVCASLLAEHARAAKGVDLSSPRAAAKSLWSAVTAGDAQSVAQTLHAENDAQREFVRAAAELLVAGERLKRAAREQFGAAGEWLGRRMIDVEDAAALDAAKVDENGDVATVTIDGAPRPLTFRKSKDGWRLVVTGPEGGRPVATPSQIALVRASARAIDEAAEEIRKGQHATAEAASAAVEQKLHAVMLEAHSGPSTRTATRPAGS